MKHQKVAVRAKPVRRIPNPLPTVIIDRARKATTCLSDLFYALDSLRAAGEACKNQPIVAEVRALKQRIAETRALVLLSDMGSEMAEKNRYQP